MTTPTTARSARPSGCIRLFLLTGLGAQRCAGMAGGYAAIGYLAVSGQLGTALIAAVAFCSVSSSSALFLYWRRFEFRVGDSEIRIDSGILSRTHRSIPFDRIQDVDISQGPVARLLGIAKVKFETGGSAGGKRGRGRAARHPARARAEELRTLVRARALGAAPSAVPADERSRAAAGVRDGPAPRAARRRVQFLAGLVRRPDRRDPDLRRRRSASIR